MGCVAGKQKLKWLGSQRGGLRNLVSLGQGFGGFLIAMGCGGGVGSLGEQFGYKMGHKAS